MPGSLDRILEGIPGLPPDERRGHLTQLATLESQIGTLVNLDPSSGFTVRQEALADADRTMHGLHRDLHGRTTKTKELANWFTAAEATIRGHAARLRVPK